VRSFSIVPVAGLFALFSSRSAVIFRVLFYNGAIIQTRKKSDGTMTAKKSDMRPAVNEERLKREAEALRANLAKRKQQQRSRKSDPQGPATEEKPED